TVCLRNFPKPLDLWLPTRRDRDTWKGTLSKLIAKETGRMTSVLPLERNRSSSSVGPTEATSEGGSSKSILEPSGEIPGAGPGGRRERG
ncbi:unnamed protein product, partial [Discosporangium mesarthrocarpum]